MERIVQLELLDTLPPQDRGAMRSRRDLRRLNRWMGHPGILLRALRRALPAERPLRLVDLGAGDGEFLLAVARGANGRWRGTEALLVDRHDLLQARTRRQFAAAHWRVQVAASDVFDWLQGDHSAPAQAVVANLFLHHFREPQLRALFRTASARTPFFIALEPRRGPVQLWLSRCLGLLGCGAVTRHDAPASVRAGFSGTELTTLWPERDAWHLAENRVGWATHLFVARRKG